jgi:hypothetical protein
MTTKASENKEKRLLEKYKVTTVCIIDNLRTTRSFPLQLLGLSYTFMDLFERVLGFFVTPILYA